MVSPTTIPIKEYFCLKCHHAFDKTESYRTRDDYCFIDCCPKCHSERIIGKNEISKELLQYAHIGQIDVNTELESESRGLRDALKLREEENEQAHARVAELEEHKQHTQRIMDDVGKINDLLGVYDLCQIVEAVEKWQNHIAELEAETKHLYQQIEIQVDIEKAITTSLRAQIKTHRARIVELETELKAAIELNIEAEYMDKMNELWRDLHRVKGTNAYLESESRGLRDALKLREEENEQAHDRIAELEADAQWHDASEPPEDDRHVLLAIEWTNYAGKRVRRWCMALHLKQFEEEYCGDDSEFAEYEEGNSIGYCPEGWYEFRNNEDDYLMVWENEITLIGWRDLPPMPKRKTTCTD